MGAGELMGAGEFMEPGEFMEAGEFMGAGELIGAGLAAVVFVFGFYEALLRSSRGGSGPVS